jgi:methionyl-tRNA formyltransferase
MRTSEHTSVCQHLANGIGYHRNLAAFYTDLFNKHHPRVAGGHTVDITQTSDLCTFYQKMSQHHILMNWQFAELLEEFRALNSGVQPADKGFTGGLPSKSAGCP